MHNSGTVRKTHSSLLVDFSVIVNRRGANHILLCAGILIYFLKSDIDFHVTETSLSAVNLHSHLFLHICHTNDHITSCGKDKCLHATNTCFLFRDSCCIVSSTSCLIFGLGTHKSLRTIYHPPSCLCFHFDIRLPSASLMAVYSVFCFFFSQTAAPIYWRGDDAHYPFSANVFDKRQIMVMVVSGDQRWERVIICAKV